LPDKHPENSESLKIQKILVGKICQDSSSKNRKLHEGKWKIFRGKRKEIIVFLPEMV